MPADFHQRTPWILQLCFRRRHKEAVVIQFPRLFGEEVVEREVVQEALGAIHAIAILIVVGGVVGVGHDEHVVLLGLGAHGVVADDQLPRPRRWRSSS